MQGTGTARQRQSDHGWPVGGGELGALIRAFDWEATPLGPIAGWPQSLRTAVDLCLAWPEPASVFWGPRHVQIYNDAYARTPPVRHPAMLGRPALENWPGARDPLGPVLARLAAGEGPFVSEDHPVQVAGVAGPEERYFTFTFVAIRDEAGAVGGVFHRAVETTGRVRAEAALRASEALFREFGDAASDVLWIRDAATRQFVYVSPAFEEIYGVELPRAWDGDDLARWAALLHPEDRAGALAALARVGEGERVTHEFRIVHPADGAVRWVRDTSFPVRDAAGAIRRIGGIGRDITAEKQTEAALRESEARYRLIVESARDYAIFTLDEAGRIDGWAAGAEAAFGWPAAEAVGQPVAITFTPEDRASGVPEQELATARERGVAPNVRWHQRQDGGRVFIEGVTRALPADGSWPGGFLKIGQDVTARREIEARLRETLETMEARVAERTAELRALSRQLLAVREEEQHHLSRELHDQIGQLLTGLQLALTRLHPEADDESATLDHAREIADDLQGRVRALILDLRPPALDEFGLLAALSDHLGRYTRQTGVQVELRHHGADRRFPPAVEIAAFRIVQEALTNVARHADTDQAAVLLLGDDTLFVQVRDEGRGFAPEGAHDGSGLAGMRERATLLGGSLTVEPNDDGGTVVAAEFPLDDDGGP